MITIFERKQIADGVFFSKITDKRYKVNQISLVFFTDYSEFSRADYSAAAGALAECCEKFPSYSALSKRLAELYDATLSSTTSLGAWDKRMTVVRASVIDDRYALDGERLEEEICGLLCECIMKPLAENGVFDARLTELVKAEIIDDIDSIVNDKAAYAAQCSAKTAFIGEPQESSPHGSHELAEKITPASAYGAYRRMLETAHIEVLCTGCSEFSAAENMFVELFSDSAKIPRHDICELSVSASPLKAEPKYVSDTMPMEQAILRMYFKAPELCDRYANMVFTVVLGGMTTSRFFRNIREKQSLCYYCAAAGSVYKKYLCAYAGVEPRNIERTQQAILAEIADIAENGITEEELSAAFLELRTSFSSMYDSASTLGSWYLSRLLDDEILSPEEYYDEVRKVTSERVAAVARQYKLDTVYTLSGGDGE